MNCNWITQADSLSDKNAMSRQMLLPRTKREEDRETKEGENREDIVFFTQDGREMVSEKKWKKEERGTLIC